MAHQWIAQEAAALESRLSAVPRFGATIPMVADSEPSNRALHLADKVVSRSKRILRRQVREFGRGLARERAFPGDLRRTQRRYQVLRGRFDALLTTVDVFADALTQRSEHGVGTLLCGLDALALDGLRLHPAVFRPPPVVCYLDRGVGGAIRRILTRLPGGESNAVALIRLPRERLCGNGFASLLHEVGHQGAALLALPEAFAQLIGEGPFARRHSNEITTFWTSKISEIIADLWACAKLGAGATLGLFAVLGRGPRFTFHDQPGDPHPMPWLRARLSIAFGAAAMPHSLWAGLHALWQRLYPVEEAPKPTQRMLARLEPSIADVAELVARKSLPILGGRTLASALGSHRVSPATLLPRLEGLIRAIRTGHGAIAPCVVLGAVTLARHRGLVSPFEENHLLELSLRRWADGN
jgi:hypothetical protein